METGGSSAQGGDMRLNDSVTLREIASEAREKAMFDRMERMEKQMETLTTILHELRSERRVTQEERMRVGGVVPGPDSTRRSQTTGRFGGEREQERDQVAARDPGRAVQLEEEVRRLAQIIDDMQGRSRAPGWRIMLTSFCLENYTLEFPSLERVSVTLCPDMKTFSQGILSTPKLYKVQVTKNEEGELHHWEGNKLNSTIQKCYEEMIAFRDIKHLQLSHFPRLQEIWHGQALPVSFFNNLFKLVVDDCTNMSSAIPANLLRCLNNLGYLQVRNCDSLEEVLHLEELSAKEEHIGPPFPRLFSLRLIDLPKLKRFCNFIENIIEMPKLEYLTIENCPDMETFVSNSVVYVTTDNKEPQKLKSEENLFVADQIQHLFDEKVAFPQLMKLKLSGLHKVQHLWKENAESNKVFANLKSLEISECSKLQKLVPTSWHLENLKALKVSKCHRLINVLTFSTSESLVNLERMKIIDCKMIEEIIQSQAGEEAKDCIVFRKLKYLGLDCLPSLTSFCLGNYALEFPSLKRAVVRQCPKMKILDTPMLNKVNVTEEEKDDDEEDDVDMGCRNSKEEIEPILQTCKTLWILFDAFSV
ncbi:hypothetical protein CUMW_249380 [Citrus unshiu]|uniref:Disease resistance protein At4g27190-like leucine-rich repeats domain-containing protein n=1 Tax=Citrus unshiu TaxID=55188 RepID=A0A2H5QPL2_CITUN|nr:hypothetical protein CUMW_249380 [Citrus unshiu]